MEKEKACTETNPCMLYVVLTGKGMRASSLEQGAGIPEQGRCLALLLQLGDERFAAEVLLLFPVFDVVEIHALGRQLIPELIAVG